jgi:hypothetical protein
MGPLDRLRRRWKRIRNPGGFIAFFLAGLGAILHDIEAILSYVHLGDWLRSFPKEHEKLMSFISNNLAFTLGTLGVLWITFLLIRPEHSRQESRLSIWISPIKIEKLGLVLPIDRGLFLARQVISICVQNKGQQTVNCHANILVEYGIKDWTKKKEARACWYKGNGLPHLDWSAMPIDAERLRKERYCDSIEIASGEICQFIVAILFEGGWNSYKWTVPYTYRKRTTNAENSFLEASTENYHHKGADRPKVRIAVTVIPDIPPVHDLPCTYVQIEGKEATSRLI